MPRLSKVDNGQWQRFVLEATHSHLNPRNGQERGLSNEVVRLLD